MRRRRRGKALAEFALVLPAFLIMLMAVVDIGRAIWAQNSVAAAAREGARDAIVHGGSHTTAGPGGPISPDRKEAPPGVPGRPHLAGSGGAAPERLDVLPVPVALEAVHQGRGGRRRRRERHRP